MLTLTHADADSDIAPMRGPQLTVIGISGVRCVSVSIKLRVPTSEVSEEVGIETRRWLRWIAMEGHRLTVGLRVK